MSHSTDSDLWVTWDDYNHLVERLALIVHESGYAFDQILCLARGGLRVGDVMSRIFDVPLAILSTSSYRAAGGKMQGDLDISKYITMTKGEFGGRVLVVDDLVDSGVTLERVGMHLREHYTQVTEVRTAVIWWKACSKVKPDYYVDFLATNPWIHQPFEDYDTLRPNQLAAWVKKGRAA
ncbi:nicotinate phosphoribosyltransferase [beta proteobacterium AAP99]|nr:nicotinate phosphoribosyltransferase [beta proteobacterium AAP99]